MIRNDPITSIVSRHITEYSIIYIGDDGLSAMFDDSNICVYIT